MKRVIQCNIDDNITRKIEVIFEIELDYIEKEIAAANYKGFEIPEGELLPAEKDAIINTQAYADYEAFIESVEDLLTDYYDLHVYYKNNSPDNSFYYGVLAKNSDATLILDFSATFRISNHKGHRTDQQTKNKKEQKAKLKELANGKKLQIIYKPIIVNQETFESYFEAFEAVDSIVSDAVQIMERRKY